MDRALVTLTVFSYKEKALSVLRDRAEGRDSDWPGALTGSTHAGGGGWGGWGEGRNGGQHVCWDRVAARGQYEAWDMTANLHDLSQ